MAVSDEEVARINERLRSLKEEHPRAGVRSFLFPTEECT